MPIPEVLAEQALVPYEASLFRAARALVLAPHADDEVFGCGAAIASLRGAGAEVRVLVLTDGAAGLADAAERRRVSAARLAESRAAMEALGGARVECLELPDRGLLSLDAELRAGIRAALRAFSPDLLFVPSPCEVHPDHRAAARAALGLLAEEARAPEPTLAFYEVSQPIRPSFLLDATPHLPALERAVAAYGSQLGTHDYAKVIRGLKEFRSLTLGRGCRSAEAYFVTTMPELRAAGAEALLRAMGPSELWPSRERDVPLSERGADGLHFTPSNEVPSPPGDGGSGDGRRP